MLQWGRVLWDAERIPHSFGECDLSGGLQWGRVLWDAESDHLKKEQPRQVMLQWGRVLWDAESNR